MRVVGDRGEQVSILEVELMELAFRVDVGWAVK